MELGLKDLIILQLREQLATILETPGVREALAAAQSSSANNGHPTEASAASA